MTGSRHLPRIDWPEGISEAERDELRDVLLAFDAAAEDFERDHTVIFPSERDRLRLFHAAQKRWFKAWQMPGPCMHPGCTSPSIPRSHAIPMSASLREIAEQGHVVTPRLGNEGLSVSRIGIQEASTFPGFCHVHEAQFAPFESQKAMTATIHFCLQAFRTICREIYAKRHYAQKLQCGLDDYRKLRDAFIKVRLSQVQRAKPLELGRVAFENDSLEDHAVAKIKESSQVLAELETLYHDILADLTTGAGSVVMQARKIDVKFPVCLSGIGGVGYRCNGAERHALCVLAAIPEASATNFIIAGESAHSDFLERYMDDNSSTAMLGRVESWMCYGSDHWFMTPSAWHAIPRVRRDAICSRILDDARSFAYPLEFSVLDAARNQILASAEDQLRSGAIPAAYLDRAKLLIADERSKLSWVGPAR